LALIDREKEMIFLDKPCPFVKIMLFDEEEDSPDKTKPSARRGRKAAGADEAEAWPSYRRKKLR